MGHCETQPRQARQRSSAPRTSFERPAISGQAAGHHLLEQACPAPGGVLFIARGAEARAHQLRALGGDAATHADAALDRRAEVAVVVAVGLGGPHVQAARCRGAQVSRDRRGRDDDLRVEHAGWVPEVPEGREGSPQLRAELALQQGPAGAAVAVLAGQRAAVGDDEVRRRLHEAAEALLATGPVQAEADAQVEAALAEVAVADGRQVVLPEQRAQLAQVTRQALGRHGRVLEAGPGGEPAGEARRVTRAILADAPERGLSGLVRDESDVRRIWGAADGRRQPCRVRARLGRRVPSCLDEQPGTARRKPDLVPGGVGQLQQLGGEGFHGEGPFREQRRDGSGPLDVIGEGEHQQAAGGGRSHQADGGPGDDGAGPLRAHEGAGHVPAALRQQPVQRVARDAPGPGRQLTADERLVLGGEAGQGGSELA